MSLFANLFGRNTSKTQPNDISKIKRMVEHLFIDKTSKNKIPVLVKEEVFKAIPLTNIQRTYKTPTFFIRFSNEESLSFSFYEKYFSIVVFKNNSLLEVKFPDILYYIKTNFHLHISNIDKLSNSEINTRSVYNNKLLLYTPVRIQSENDMILDIIMNDNYNVTFRLTNRLTDKSIEEVFSLV